MSASKKKNTLKERDSSSSSAPRRLSLQDSFVSIPPPPRINRLPKLHAIRTLSNTRVDKRYQYQGGVERRKNNLQTNEKDELKHLRTKIPELHKNKIRNSDEIRPTKPKTRVSRLINNAYGTSTANDLEFGYDYDVYMHQVTKAPEECFRNRNKFRNKQNEEKEGVGDFGPNQNINANNKRGFEDHNLPWDPLRNPSLGMELLDVSDSVVIRICSTPLPVVQEAFQKMGAYPFGVVYEVITRSGSPLLYYTETTNCINRLLSCNLLGCSNPFTAQIVDVCGKPSMTVTNGLNCSCCCYLLCYCGTCTMKNREFKVSLADGEVLGVVNQTRGDRCNPGFLLRDSNFHRIMQAAGPRCSICDTFSSILSVICCCFSCLIDDDVFYFTDRAGNDVAQVRKILMKETTPVYSSEWEDIRNSNLWRDGESIESDSSDGDANFPAKGDEQEQSDDCSTSSTTKKDDSEKFCDEKDFEVTSSYHVLIDFTPGLSLRKKALILVAGFVIDFLYWQSSSDYY